MSSATILSVPLARRSSSIDPNGSDPSLFLVELPKGFDVEELEGSEIVGADKATKVRGMTRDTFTPDFCPPRTKPSAVPSNVLTRHAPGFLLSHLFHGN